MTLPTVFNVFPANWRKALQLETAWQTDITTAAETLAEERRSVWGSPNRTLRTLVSGLTQKHLHSLLMRLARHADQQIYVPLYSDQALVQGVFDSNTLEVDTRFKRIYAGYKIFVLRVQDGIVVDEKLLTVAAVSDIAIDLESPDTTTGIQAGDWVFPAVLVETLLSHSATMITDELLEAEFSLPEVIGPSSLPASETAFPPPGFDTYQGLPILNPDPDWGSTMSVGVSRGGNKYESGRGVVVELAGRRPQFSYPLQFLAPDRETFWNHLRFFDSIKGRRKPFWAIAPHSLFEFTGFGTDYVLVEPSGDLSDITELLDYVGIELVVGVVVIRKIEDAVTFAGGLWKISFTEDLPEVYTLSQVRRVTSAHLVRSSIDFLRETWHTENACFVEFQLVELLEERSVEIENVNPGVEFGWPVTVPDLLWWFAAHSNCYSDPAKPAAVADLAMSDFASVEDEDFQQVSLVTDVRYKPFNFTDPYLGAAGSILPPVLWQMKKGVSAFRRAFTAISAGSGDAHDEFKILSAGGVDYQADFFSNTLGLTVFAVWQFKDAGAFLSRILFRDAVFQWTSQEVRIFETDGGVSCVVTGLGPYTQDGTTHVMAVRWVPGSQQKVYIDGRDRGTPSGAPVSTIPTVARGMYIRIVDNSGPPGSGTEDSDDKFFEIIVWPRALTTLELNTVGSGLAETYDTIWKVIP